MMGSNGQTIVAYTGGTPTITGTVILFDSSVAFRSVQTPAGGSLHLLGLQWFQWVIGLASAGSAASGTVTGAYSVDKGSTWRDFYVATIVDGALTATAVSEDEVYIGIYKDVQFRYLNAGEAPTVFEVQLALNTHKPSSKAAVPTTDFLVPQGAVT